MIVFKNKDGFTLTEVLLAVAIIGLTLTPIYLSQSTAMRQSALYSRLLGRVFAAKKVLLESELSLPEPLQPIKVTKKIDDPSTTFAYELRKMPEQSSLKKFKNIWVESVSWPDERNPKRQQRLVTFIYKPEQKKNE
jgi:prepilin-type N-terminal cleavage/methylation domain-containing protein